MKSGLKVGWKVLRKRTDGSFSSSHCGILTYSIGQWTKPEKGKGPLCVFTTKKAAERFIFTNCCLAPTILPCVYVPSKLKAVWNSKAEWDRMPLSRLPNRKALANKVMILQEPL